MIYIYNLSKGVEPLPILNNWFMLQRTLSSYGAHGKFGEHERSVRVARGVAEGNSSFLSALQTSQVLHNSIVHSYKHEPIEGFDGKRALGILHKIGLCQKHSKFRMQFCLGVLNNVLHVFSPEACFLFEILRMRKNKYFRGHPLGTFC